MTSITIKGREYMVEATGLTNIAYKLHSGKLTLTGIRNRVNTDLIIVADSRSRTVGAFLESKMAEVTLR